ncbi:hypothetical protein GYA37_03880 [candidate division WWE3 bacterium]|uniref:Soluble ligand binding domain-containing protein n=1 Tax=candidate division WWE3 bacterium TaxID=2053526 RepID=A0A7X9E7R9_UNCKA|nr:hypothetical protein [candidate division WWE3 bacterium]
MKEKISSFISNVIKKNLMVVAVLLLMLGGIVGFIFARKKVATSCVLAMEGVVQDQSKEIKKIVVDLSGAVKKPGLYELDEGSRVGELLDLGGGTTEESSALWISKNLNLSKKLEDSSKVYIPFEWETYSFQEDEILNLVKPSDLSSNGSSNKSQSDSSESTNSQEDSLGDASSASSKINVNTATSSELDALPGIGPAFAEKIISNRPYSDFLEFESKSGLWKSVSAGIKDLISF